MKNILFIALCFSGILNAQTDVLWEKSVQIFSAHEKWIPGKMKMDMQLLDKNGDTEHVAHFEYKMYLGQGDQVETELVHAFENGKDVTAEYREKNAKNSGEPEEQNNQEFGISSKDSPFHPDNQEKVIYEKTGEDRIDGTVCITFEYTLASDDGNQVGTAWINKDGFPVRLVYTIEPLPKGMKKMMTTCDYTVTEEKKLELSRMKLSGTAGFLFIKKNFNSTFTFSDYWQEP